MSFPVRPNVLYSSVDPSRCKILESRDQYRSCHIHVPDSKGRLAAIVFSDRYYSFFRLVKDAQKAIQIAAKLVYRGDEVVITRTAKGDVLWIYESQAWGSKPRQQDFIPIAESGLWKILASDREFQSCQIRVPDVAKPLMAIYVERQYFSFLRSTRDRNSAIELVDRLAKKGHASRITRNAQTWSVWVLESEASIQI